jgi:thioesterase domain-containing protein
MLVAVSCRGADFALGPRPDRFRIKAAIFILDGSFVPTPSHLISIQAGSGGAGLFLIHSVAGEFTWSKYLARRLGPKQAVYAFAAPGLNSDAPFFFSLEAMASVYLRDMRRLQPSGPYMLGGYSMGGVIAFEMARQLQACGEQVRLLVMIDAFAPDQEHTKNIVAWSRNGLLMQVIGNQLALQWKSEELLAPDVLPQLPFTAHSACVTRHLLSFCEIPHSQASLESYLRRCQVMMRVHAQLLADYKPTPLEQDIPCVLFRNTLGLIGNPSRLNLPVLSDSERDPPHRWEGLLQSSPMAIDVPEEHFMLGNEASMDFICHALREFVTG